MKTNNKNQPHWSLFAPFCLVNVAHYMLYEAEHEHIFHRQDKQLFNRAKKAAYEFEQRFFQITHDKTSYDMMKYQRVLDDFRDYLASDITLLKLYIRQKISNSNHSNVEILTILCTLNIIMQMINISSKHAYRTVDPRLSTMLKNSDRLIDNLSTGDQTVVTLDDPIFQQHIKVISKRIEKFDYTKFL